jgi:hypothetical protein
MVLGRDRARQLGCQIKERDEAADHDDLDHDDLGPPMARRARHVRGSARPSLTSRTPVKACAKEPQCDAELELPMAAPRAHAAYDVITGKVRHVVVPAFELS